MGGHDNNTSIEISKYLWNHQPKFIRNRTKLNKEWKSSGADRKVTFIEYCKMSKHERKNFK